MRHLPCLTAIAGTATVAASSVAGPCTQTTVQNDSTPNESAPVNLCPCFAPNEVAMAILDVPQGGTAILSQIQIFWASFLGGQPDSLEAAVIVYDMNQSGAASPSSFVPLCSEMEGCILQGPVMQDGGLNAFDVSPLQIQLPASRFGIGLEFLTDQTEGNPLATPTVASDTDGQNNSGGVVRNWVLVDGVTWTSSQSLGVSGDWIIRAVVDVCPDVTPCPWDIAPGSGDGVVDVADFLALLAQWGLDPGGPPDFDGNGSVDVGDFLELLAHWGSCA